MTKGCMGLLFLSVIAMATARVPGTAVLEFVLDFPEPFAPVLDCPLDSSNLLFHPGNVLADSLRLDAKVLGVGRAHPLLFCAADGSRPDEFLDGVGRNSHGSRRDANDGQRPAIGEPI